MRYDRWRDMFRGLIAGFVAIGLLIGASSFAGAADYQRWTLREGIDLEHGTNGFLARNDTGTESGYVTFSSPISLIFRESESAVTSIDMGGPWDIMFKFLLDDGVPSNPVSGTFELGKLTGDSEFVSFWTDTRVYSSGFLYYIPIEFELDSFLISAGEFLAVRISYSGGGLGSYMNVYTGYDDGTQVLFRQSTPGYPTPELSTLMLYGAGVIAIGAFVSIRRGRK